MRALVALEGGPELALYEVGRAPRVVDERALGLAGRAGVSRVRGGLPRRLLAGLGRSADTRLGGVDVFHQTSPVPVLVRRAPETLAVAELFEPGSSAGQELGERCRRAAGVLVFAEHVARALEEAHGVSPGRIHRVPVGADHWLRDLVRDGRELPPRDSPASIVVLGALRGPRRHTRLLAAAGKLAARGTPVQLHVVGRFARVLSDQVKDAVAGSLGIEVTCSETLSEPELARRVAGASVLVHLDDEAATPVTPMEALALGTPVVASRIPAFEEALKGAAELVDNAAVDRGPEELVRALERALAAAEDEEGRARRMRHAERFTWEANARATVKVWEGVVAG